MPFRYPISLELAGRKCVVIGGGAVAEEKVRSLLIAEAAVTVISPRFTAGLKELALRGELEIIEREYALGDLEGAFLAIAATDDPSVHPLIYREAEERRVLLNSVDDIDHCHFAVPSVVRRGDFQIAISTGGRAPALSKRLRERFEQEFGEEYSVLIELLGDVREDTLPSRPDFPTWARRWQSALGHDLLGHIRKGELAQAKEIVRRTLLGETVEPAAGKVFIVGAGPGDPGLITVRGRDALLRADVVVHDRLVHPSLLEGKEAIYAGKTPGGDSISQEEINEMLVSLALGGKTVVRLKGGDPFVFGRGAEEAEALAQAGIPFEVIPAPSSAIAVPAYAGIPVTDRRFSSSVAIVTGRTEGREVNFRSLAETVDTIVVLMGVGKLDEITSELLTGGLDPETPAAIIENGTLPEERVIVSTLAELSVDASAASIGPPAVIVIGEVVRVRERMAGEPALT